MLKSGPQRSSGFPVGKSKNYYGNLRRRIPGQPLPRKGSHIVQKLGNPAANQTHRRTCARYDPFASKGQKGGKERTQGHLAVLLVKPL